MQRLKRDEMLDNMEDRPVSKEGSASIPYSLAQACQIICEKPATSLKSSAVAVYPLQIVLMKVLKKQRKFLNNGLTLALFRPVGGDEDREKCEENIKSVELTGCIDTKLVRLEGMIIQTPL